MGKFYGYIVIQSTMSGLVVWFMGKEKESSLSVINGRASQGVVIICLEQESNFRCYTRTRPTEPNQTSNFNNFHRRETQMKRGRDICFGLGKTTSVCVWLSLHGRRSRLCRDENGNPTLHSQA
jgi:hypothetical protein